MRGNGGGGVCEGAAVCVVVVGWWQCRVTAGEDVMEADMEKVASVASNDCHNVGGNGGFRLLQTETQNIYTSKVCFVTLVEGITKLIYYK